METILVDGQAWTNEGEGWIPLTFQHAEQRLAAVAANADPTGTAVLFAMPTRPEEALKWGFEAQKAQDYAAAGAKTLRKLKSSGGLSLASRCHGFGFGS